MRIAVDVMGGDKGCGAVVAGVRQALKVNSRIQELFLVGDESTIKAALSAEGCDDSRVTIQHASEVLTMLDKPLEGVKRKKDSSLVRAIELVKDGKADAVISTGNTGALMAAATIKLRRIPSVDRAALSAVMPSFSSEFILMDAGANAECKPVHLAQFAVMGSIYSREILGRANPRVGILSNGTEEIKGNELTRQTLGLCQQLDLNFIGYVEGHALFDDQVEVVITDGFTGNIVLKSCESLGKSIKRTLKDSLSASPIRKLGALLAADALRGIKARFDADVYGGAPLLGLKGNVIKAHGSSGPVAIENAVRVAAETVKQNLSEIIEREVGLANERLDKLAGAA